MKYVKIYTTLFAILVLHTITFGQLKPADTLMQITKVQLTKIEELNKELEQQITRAFSKNLKLKMDMESELKMLAAIKDDKLQKVAARRYQDKYMKVYNDILKSGKVDLVLYARKMEMIVPWYKFSVNSRNEIIGQMQRISENATIVQAGPVFKKITEFKQSIYDNTCFVAAGGGFTFTDNSMKVNAVSAVAGACYQSGSMETYPDSDTEAFNSVKIKSKVQLNGFAIAIVGVSSVSGSAFCRFSPKPEDGKYIGSFWLLAPLFWVGIVSDEIVQDDIFDYRPGRKILFSSSLHSLSEVISETHAEVNLTDIEVILTSR